MSDVPTHPQNTVVTDITGTEEVQSVKVDGTSGTFTLTFDGATTAAIDFDATTAELVAALEAIESIDPGEVSATGGPGDDGGTKPYLVTFLGDLADINQPILGDADSLVGGGADVTVTQITAGAANTTAVQRGTGNADREADVSPLDGLSPVEYRAANKADFGDA